MPFPMSSESPGEGSVALYRAQLAIVLVSTLHGVTSRAAET